MKKAKKMGKELKNCIIYPAGKVEKRKSIDCPVVDMHSKPIVVYAQDEFIIYEQYGTWYLEILNKR